MEFFGWLILIIIGSVIWNVIQREGRAASNKLIVKVEKFKEGEFDGYGVYCKGAPTVGYARDITFIVKLTDDETKLPVLSTFEQFSEPGSRAFESVVPVGVLQPGGYWPDWIRLTGFNDQMIIGPHKGRRKVKATIFVWDSNYLPNFRRKAPEATEGGIEIKGCIFEYNFVNPGYFELDKVRLRTQELSVQLGVSIAMADGSFDDKEGDTIKKWMKEIVETSLEDQKKNIKDKLNKALEDAFQNVEKGELNLDILCKEVKEKSSTIDKFDLLELCLDVMAADGVADEKELAHIREISNKIDVDYEEVIKLKDQRIVSLETPQALDSNTDEALGIDPEWSDDEKRKFILKEFTKWNRMLSALKEGKEKQNAQAQLDLLAKARQKYG